MYSLVKVENYQNTEYTQNNIYFQTIVSCEQNDPRQILLNMGFV